MEVSFNAQPQAPALQRVVTCKAGALNKAAAPPISRTPNQRPLDFSAQAAYSGLTPWTIKTPLDDELKAGGFIRTRPRPGHSGFEGTGSPNTPESENNLHEIQ